MRDPEVEARKLKLRFRAATARIERAQRRRSIAHHLLRAVPVLVVTLGLVVGGFMASPWAPVATVRHLLAFPNCASARLVGLAPARRGEPGYYSRHDRDDDGVACEPLIRWSNSGASFGDEGRRAASALTP
ncbi:hypothetical protein E9232_003157 [Inquilinus ginsengisoli]|uniref:Excalibur calcium-binding domain-containing protein n=1 Tax=Inquilinus ginsengisoli TaxID=363840 RepID=A0ABU1JPT5_9PROT|nr:excalibur calcium-binding domain-containing protein [Inquilinus ginsengisoli]MDR6290631.1 hypothetical protein [Inquilinus ginsengisoli]